MDKKSMSDEDRRAVKHRRRRATALILALALFCAAAVAYVQRSYFPMGGTVAVTDKGKDVFGYYIKIEQPGPGGARPRFTLRCEKDAYDAAEVGATLNCERYQSVMTHMGYIHSIKGLAVNTSRPED